MRLKKKMTDLEQYFNFLMDIKKVAEEKPRSLTILEMLILIRIYAGRE